MDGSDTLMPLNGAISTLVVSHDSQLAGQLCGVLEQQHGCRAVRASTYDAAGIILSRNGLQSVFVDLRAEHSHEDPAPFLEQLSARRNGHRIPVVAISNEGYTCKWAGLADATVSAHLRLPIDQQKLCLLIQRMKEESLPNPAEIESRVVQSKSVKYHTYTPELFGLVQQLVQMAVHDVTLLLVGETGTGKTTIARLVHELSPRCDEMFLTVACGALPPELIESELFGHVKGAFTSADRTKAGKFEIASQGTILLDEIDVLEPAQQAKLLRVIESGEFEPVGSNETKRTRARLIVASNVELRELMESERFRSDLYYRLNVLEFHLPPLRQRPLDIVPLALGFIEDFCLEHNIAIRRICPEFLDTLKGYDWPGNIRELRNHIRRAVLYCRGNELTPLDLAPVIVRAAHESKLQNSATPRSSTLSEKVAYSEREILEKALAANGHKRTTTARSLGISRVGLYKKMKKYGMIANQRTAITPDKLNGNGNGNGNGNVAFNGHSPAHAE
jgi:DNA-binding NtrC family response regulator